MAKIDEVLNGNCSLYLDKVEYKRIGENECEVSLNIKDDIEVKLDDKHQGITAIITRNLSFDPISLFEIAVTFGVYLEVNDNCEDLETLDLNAIKDEFLEDGCVITNIVMSRISLIISQLTSSFGERPIVTPPSIME